ncbi:hypothetical protein SPD48_12770 [Pseudogracilibacillus sp. SE30717A]|uniref:hypothetical protein n=1 Tax=Pseudogracilibacillus sp. SE30717A TaxID=3098293 RepID=UPI00300E6049
MGRELKTSDYIKFLRRAIGQVRNEYYGNEKWIQSMINGADLNPTKNQLEETIIPHLSKHYERVFCYELYHQLRRVLQKEQGDLEKKVILQAELQKKQISDEVEDLMGISKLEGRYIPDFLIHEPHTVSNQNLIIEVKANPNLNDNEMLDDIKKIDQFISRYRFEKGVFLSINISKEKLKKLLSSKKLLSCLESEIENHEKILVMFKESHESELIHRNLGKLIENMDIRL